MKFIVDILRGCALGVANIIPGVSGGTLAVSMGIYDKIINSVTGLFRHFKKSVRKRQVLIKILSKIQEKMPIESG